MRANLERATCVMKSAKETLLQLRHLGAATFLDNCRPFELGAFELMQRLPPPAPSHRHVVLFVVLRPHPPRRWSLCSSSPLVLSASSERGWGSNERTPQSDLTDHSGQVTSGRCAGASGRLCSCPPACARAPTPARMGATQDARAKSSTP